MNQRSLIARRVTTSRFSRELFMAFHDMPSDQKIQIIEMLIRISPPGDKDRISVLRRAMARAKQESGVT